MANTDIYSLAEALGAKNLTRNLGASPLGRKYLLQQERAKGAEEFLDSSKTAGGAITGGIALYLERKQENKALEELNTQMQAEQEAKAARRESLINALPEANRVIAGALTNEDDLAKYAMQTLTPPSEEDKLALENRRLQNQKLKKEISSIGYSSRGDQPIGNYSPKVANAIDTDLLKNSNALAATAESSAMKLGQLEEILNRNKTGKVSGKLEAAGQYVPFVNSKDYQAAQQLSTDLGLESSALLKGQTSDKDVARSIAANPSWDYENSANEIIIKNKKAFLKTLQDKADFDNNWVSRYGSTLATDERGISHKKAWQDTQKQLFVGYGGEIVDSKKKDKQGASVPQNDRKQALKNKYGLN